MIQVNRIYLIFNRLVTKKFLVDTSERHTETISNNVKEQTRLQQREQKQHIQYTRCIKRIKKLSFLHILSEIIPNFALLLE